MRVNLPVTQRDHPMSEGVTLLSTTDTASRITYANAAFIEISGFEREELMGQPHNLVRHPDMPPEAFADMWATLEAGDSWTALVKNRRKDGDHYWVRANVTPVRREGVVQGYMSVRTCPAPEEIARAETLYADLREGRAKGRAFHKGLVVRHGLGRWRSLWQRASLRARVAVALAFAGGPGLLSAAFSQQPPWIVPLALLGWLAAAVWMERQVSAPLQQVLGQARSVASGQPGPNLHFNRVDEIGMLMRAVNQAGLNQRSLVDDVGAQVSGMRGATQDIAAGNSDLSRRTEQAAANLQETAASMEQLNSAVRHNADIATEAARLASDASQAAIQGGRAVGDVVTTMNHITDSSRRIGDIVGVIDGLAFQTNLLALNAAVEAARAGEQGRGFAVVAGEVRSLAQRSADAAREIKGLIAESTGKVEAGAQQVQRAGDTMGALVSQVQQVTQLIGEISSASRDQTAGLTQIATAIADLDRATQQNAALVEQSAAAAAQLVQRTGRLVEAVGVFKG